jgi:dihydroxyacetone kinase
VVVADQPSQSQEALQEALVDHRAVEHVLRRVADRRASTARVKRREELVVDELVHDRRAERRAALAGRAEAAEQRALDGEVEVGVGHHDERVLAAELQARRLEVAARTARRCAAPTSVEPVKPTLSSTPAPARRSRPAKVCARRPARG